MKRVQAHVNDCTVHTEITCVCVHLLTVIYQRRQIRDKPETKPVSFSATLDPLITLSLATVKKKKKRKNSWTPQSKV